MADKKIICVTNCVFYIFFRYYNKLIFTNFDNDRTSFFYLIYNQIYIQENSLGAFGGNYDISW